MNHYALFKCYMFLKNCGSGDVLLKIVKVEHEEMPEAKSVVAVLEEFMGEAPTQSFWSRVRGCIAKLCTPAPAFDVITMVTSCHRIAIEGDLKYILDFFILYF